MKQYSKAPMDLAEFEAKSAAIATLLRAFSTQKYAKSAAQTGVEALISVSLSIKELLAAGEKILLDAGVEDYKNDAELLLCFVLSKDKTELFLKRALRPDAERAELYLTLIERRAGGEPLQYITGEQYFMGRRFIVTPAVLIPRFETELLAEKAILYLNERSGARTALDLCTGSGALACSIAAECPHIRVIAADISANALDIARQNAQNLGVADRIRFVQSNLFDAFDAADCKEKFDLIVTNPPYIRTGDLAGLQREVKNHEPSLALDGGADGLDFYRRIARQALPFMRKDACLMAEIGCDQGMEVKSIFEAAGYKNAALHKDLSNRDRIFCTSY